MKAIIYLFKVNKRNSKKQQNDVLYCWATKVNKEIFISVGWKQIFIDCDFYRCFLTKFLYEAKMFVSYVYFYSYLLRIKKSVSLQIVVIWTLSENKLLTSTKFLLFIDWLSKLELFFKNAPSHVFSCYASSHTVSTPLLLRGNRPRFWKGQAQKKMSAWVVGSLLQIFVWGVYHIFCEKNTL